MNKDTASPQIVRLTRLFRFGATTLEDIDPDMPVSQVIAAYTGSYPFLANATVGEPITEGETLVYPISKPEVQVKGNRRAGVNAAIHEIDDWASSIAHVDPSQSPIWKQFYHITNEVLHRPPTPVADAMMVPML